MKIGFLLNHYELHQVPHLVPYAVALSRLRPDWQVSILCSTAAERAFATDIATAMGPHGCRIEQLVIPAAVRLLDPVVRQVVFWRKVAVQRANVKRFAALDMLVVPELTTLAVRDLPGCGHLKMVFTGHGAGDAQSHGSYDPRLAAFDLCLLPGRKYAEQIGGMGYLRDGHWAITGYPKFDAVDALGASRPPLFTNGRPTVLYTPHHAPDTTSWHAMGPAVLEFFAASDRWNLVFAPHVLLFHRALTRGARLPRRWRDGPTLKIDRGSLASVDMTYTRGADLYLGDASSQVYEFAERPRPCVFLNPRRRAWQGDPAFLAWTFGPVVEDVAELGPALDRAVADFDRYRPAQQAACDYTFLRGAETASDRGARALADFLDKGRLGPEWC